MSTTRAAFQKDYWGEILTDQAGDHSIALFGFENVSEPNRSKSSFTSDVTGTFWGFVQSGKARVESGDVSWTAKAGQWFCLPNRSRLSLAIEAPGTRVFAVANRAHFGLPTMGGPVEKQGRLQYIDGCTDTILYSPPVKGDPCLNLLHFPENVDQTEHFHPSSRCGIVSSGSGLCVSESGTMELVEGLIFYLPRDLRHKFKTDSNQVLDVISFHPDSDWGPTHEVHPMINRTWMDSKKT